MSTIDLGARTDADRAAAPDAAPAPLLDGLPRRVSLTQPELQAAAERAGGAPLPFDLTPPAEEVASLEGRLGASRGTTEAQAYAAAVAGLHDPLTSLVRRGLLGSDDVLDPGIAGALGLLATPHTAVDLDVAVGPVRVRAWHRQAGDAVATLATSDGIVFELAWFAVSAWPGELARVAVLPEDVTLRTSQVPAVLDLPYDLLDAASEAVASGRPDLLPVLATRASGGVSDADGAPIGDAEIALTTGALASEARGRLRALVADVRGTDADMEVVGVRSWVLVADGWRSLRPRQDAAGPRIRVESVEPDALAEDLAPVLAQVRRAAA